MSSLHRRDLGVNEQCNSSYSIDLIAWIMAEGSVPHSPLLYVGYYVGSKAICPVPCVLPKTDYLTNYSTHNLTASSARAVYATNVFFPRQQFLPHKFSSRHATGDDANGPKGQPTGLLKRIHRQAFQLF